MTGGTWSWDPGPPPWVRGSIYKKKVLQDPGPKYTHSGHNTQRSFDPPQPPPPPPTPPKKGYPGAGGYGVKIQKNHWGIIFGPKKMILHGVKRQKPYIGVCYANGPQKGGGGGYTTLAPALDLTTSLRGDFLRRLWRLVFPVLSCQSDGPTPGGGGGRVVLEGGRGGV